MLLNAETLFKEIFEEREVNAPPNVAEQLMNSVPFALKFELLRYTAPPASAVDLELMNLDFDMKIFALDSAAMEPPKL